jgi:dihydrofolate reductase
MSVHMIWAQAHDRVVGADGGIPWRLPEEQRLFRERTMGATVVMGRGTWDSLPARVRPLPGRRNVVLTRDTGWTAEGAEVAHGVDDVEVTSGEIWIIGGAAVWSEFLPLATNILRTHVDLQVAGDTRAPELGAEWVISADSGWQEGPGGLRYRVEELVRAQSPPAAIDEIRYSSRPAGQANNVAVEA